MADGECGCGCGGTCGGRCGMPGCCCGRDGAGAGFALIVVLFILLIIVGVSSVY